MPHLHEVLAVDKELEAVAWKVAEEAINTFQKKQEHFLGHDKRYEMFDEARAQEADGLREHKDITTTVPDKLKYVAGHFIRFLDSLAQKEATNQLAVADLELPDGTVLMSKVPATLLLALEGKLSKLRNVYAAIPTLQPMINWVPDPQVGPGVYRAKDVLIRHKTEKTLQFKVLVPPSDKHPAQVEKWFEDKPIGHSIWVQWSGMVSPAEKSRLLSNLDLLIQSIKKARMRANEQEVVKVHLGASLFDFINEWNSDK